MGGNFIENKKELGITELFFVLLYVVLFSLADFSFFLVSHCQPQAVSGNYRGDNEPDCRKSYYRVDDNRTDAAGAHKYPAYKVEVEYAVQSPIEGADDYEYVRNDVCNNHNLTLLVKSMGHLEKNILRPHITLT